MTTVKSKEFGKTKAGQSVTAFELSNENGMSVRILNLGGIIQSVIVPDKNKNKLDVVLGYDDVTSYENGSCYYGAVVGRYANRIGGGRFTLDGREYTLETNEEDLSRRISQRILMNVDNGFCILHYFSPI
jgi:aldose 1-epimerase